MDPVWRPPCRQGPDSRRDTRTRHHLKRMVRQLSFDPAPCVQLEGDLRGDVGGRQVPGAGGALSMRQRRDGARAEIATACAMRGIMGAVTSPPPADDPVADAALHERPDQRFIGDRDLTAWPSAAGRALAGLAVRLHRRLAPHHVLIVILAVGLALVAALTAAAGAVYDAVVEADGVAALDHPALDAAKAARTPQLTTLVQAFTMLGGPIGMPVLATVVAVGLGVAWRQWTPVLLIAATAAGSLTLLSPDGTPHSRLPDLSWSRSDPPPSSLGH